MGKKVNTKEKKKEYHELVKLYIQKKRQNEIKKR